VHANVPFCLKCTFSQYQLGWLPPRCHTLQRHHRHCRSRLEGLRSSHSVKPVSRPLSQRHLQTVRWTIWWTRSTAPCRNCHQARFFVRSLVLVTMMTCQSSHGRVEPYRSMCTLSTIMFRVARCVDCRMGWCIVGWLSVGLVNGSDTGFVYLVELSIEPTRFHDCSQCHRISSGQVEGPSVATPFTGQRVERDQRWCLPTDCGPEGGRPCAWAADGSRSISGSESVIMT
jgi:hypothetical protein